jgi:hypothetical protein
LPVPPTEASTPALNELPRSRKDAALDVARKAHKEITEMLAAWAFASEAIDISLKALADIETILAGDGK